MALWYQLGVRDTSLPDCAKHISTCAPCKADFGECQMQVHIRRYIQCMPCANVLVLQTVNLAAWSSVFNAFVSVTKGLSA